MLTDRYMRGAGKVPEYFQKIRDGVAPETFTLSHLRGLGFTSSNDNAIIPLLKALGFLTSDGKPTQRYNDYRDHSKSKAIMGQAIKDAYGDLFLINENISDSDKPAVQGKFKATHNVSDDVAERMTRTFYALLDLAEINNESSIDTNQNAGDTGDGGKPKGENTPGPKSEINKIGIGGMYYNIQIHLPATKDVEVYNSIFKSLKEHVIE